MRRWFWIIPLMGLLVGLSITRAAGPLTAEQAIQIAQQQPAIAALLASESGWTAKAYDTRNSFGIWRVDFYNKGGDSIGWASVSIAKERVFSYEANSPQVDPTDEQRKTAEAAIRSFLAGNDDVKAMVGEIPARDTWLYYDNGNHVWFLGFAHGVDNVAIAVKFNGNNPFDFVKPIFVGVYFPEMLSYGDWEKMQKDQVVALAMADAKIAAKLRGRDDWTTVVTSAEGQQWQIAFKAGDTVLATAIVNLETRSVTIP